MVVWVLVILCCDNELVGYCSMRKVLRSTRCLFSFFGVVSGGFGLFLSSGPFGSISLGWVGFGSVRFDLVFYCLICSLDSLF